MMKTNDLENELRNLKFMHLTESELAAYCDQQLDQIGRARVESHLKQCFICERQLELLREESEALSNRATTAEDVAFVERLMEQTGQAQKPSAVGSSEITREPPLRERLAEYLRQMIANWLVSFETVRHSEQGEEVWRWQSEDGHLRARATMEKNADLFVHFSSNEMELEGARLHFRLGEFSQEMTLQRISETEVYAQVAIPWPYRQGKMMSDISIEIL
jgi:hypothetical protein